MGFEWILIFPTADMSLSPLADNGFWFDGFN